MNALSLFLLVPGEDSSPVLKAATPADDPVLARHVKVVTDSRRELNKRVTNILQSGLGELASKLETAHAQERRAKGERARNVRLALLTLRCSRAPSSPTSPRVNRPVVERTPS